MKILKPNSKKARKLLLALKTFGASVVAYFLAVGNDKGAAITGLVIGGLDFLITSLSDGTDEIVKEKFEE